MSLVLMNVTSFDTAFSYVEIGVKNTNNWELCYTLNPISVPALTGIAP
jgi:hypothetical protein